MSLLRAPGKYRLVEVTEIHTVSYEEKVIATLEITSDTDERKEFVAKLSRIKPVESKMWRWKDGEGYV